MFYGSQIFRFFGVLISWIFINVIRLLSRRKLRSFLFVWKGPEFDDIADGAAYELKYILIGFAFIMALCFLIIKLGF